MPDPTGGHSLIVTLEPGSDFDRVRADLERAGLTTVRPLPAIGVIHGHAAPERKDALARVPGVRAVEKERTVQLPPPESEIQ